MVGVSAVRHRQPGERWQQTRPSLSLGSSMPIRVSTFEEPDPEFRRRPVGFTANLEPDEDEPLTWEGDDA